ncbi:hypothetical protein FA15DRAFT_700882 [Coprinopsis marcescibilis]|uniref:Uncharacterized protein n=1 Tax=Coprinopsis marcescibilis TaxID=230819 RepID=A0A5C3L7K5_COPMA|nr:hypothetical protein FA15DRAFT_700882 [Coprinopsis marcescibilis]
MSYESNNSGNSQPSSPLKLSLSAESLRSNPSCLSSSIISATTSTQSAGTSTSTSTQPPLTPPGVHMALPSADRKSLLSEQNLIGMQDDLWVRDPTVSISQWSRTVSHPGPLEREDEDWVSISHVHEDKLDPTGAEGPFRSDSPSYSRPPTPPLAEQPDDTDFSPMIDDNLGKLLDSLEGRGLTSLMERYALCHSERDAANLLLEIAEDQCRYISTRFLTDEPIATGKTIIKWANEKWKEDDPRRKYVQEVQAAMIQERQKRREQLLFDWVRQGLQSRLESVN